MIGPAGVFTVETKSHPGPVRVGRVHGATSSRPAPSEGGRTDHGRRGGAVDRLQPRVGGQAARAAQGRAPAAGADAARVSRQVPDQSRARRWRTPSAPRALTEQATRERTARELGGRCAETLLRLDRTRRAPRGGAGRQLGREHVDASIRGAPGARDGTATNAPGVDDRGGGDRGDAARVCGVAGRGTRGARGASVSHALDRDAGAEKPWPNRRRRRTRRSSRRPKRSSRPRHRRSSLSVWPVPHRRRGL